MSQFGAATAADLANMALIFYVRNTMRSQTTANKPLLTFLEEKQKSFSSGNLQISEPVQVNFMSDTAGFLQGYSADDSLNFATAANSLRAVYNWKEVQASLVINWTELKIDGITITDHQKESEHVGDGLTRLTSILKNRMEDFGESWKRAKNLMLWQDGTQDAKQVPGITALLTDTPATGSTGGLSRVTYPAWRHRVNLATPFSPANGSLIQFLNDELIQLQRFGGKPNKALCGSDWLSALRAELVAKGFFTMTGFGGRKATQLGIAGLHIDGLGDFDYDPTLDVLGASKRCVILDGERTQLRPMEGEDMKVLKPERPYNYLVFLHTVTWTGALTETQLNANAVYSIP
jgi:hypothetical protein